MAEDQKPAKAPRKKKGEGAPIAVPELTMDLKQKTIKIGRAHMRPLEAREYAKTLVILAETIERIDQKPE